MYTRGHADVLSDTSSYISLLVLLTHIYSQCVSSAFILVFFFAVCYRNPEKGVPHSFTGAFTSEKPPYHDPNQYQQPSATTR